MDLDCRRGPVQGRMSATESGIKLRLLYQRICSVLRRQGRKPGEIFSFDTSVCPLRRSGDLKTPGVYRLQIPPPVPRNMKYFPSPPSVPFPGPPLSRPAPHKKVDDPMFISGFCSCIIVAIHKKPIAVHLETPPPKPGGISQRTPVRNLLWMEVRKKLL